MSTVRRTISLPPVLADRLDRGLQTLPLRGAAPGPPLALLVEENELPAP